MAAKRSRKLSFRGFAFANDLAHACSIVSPRLVSSPSNLDRKEC